MINAVLLDPKDTVATVTKAMGQGEDVSFLSGDGMRTVAAAQAIPIYHKIAVVDTQKGRNVFKYGEKIGIALRDIAAGEHVHTHNLGSGEAGVN